MGIRNAALLLVFCCAALAVLAPHSAAAGPVPGSTAPSLAADPLYQPVPISSAVRMIVFCHCQSSTCPTQGNGGEICGGDPEIFCSTCHCIVAPDGTHICAQGH